MKTQLLDIEATLSCAAAQLQQTPPAVEKALAHIEAAREDIFKLLEGLEKSELN